MPATDLPAGLFDVPANIPLIHQVVVAQLAAARQGTHKTKNRGEVSGSGKKPFKQKGTGRSRQGSVRAPEHTGGGTVHGPRPRSYAQRTPKKMIAAALLGALSDRARAGRVHVLELAGETPSTKAARIALADVRSGKRQLVVLGRDEIVAAKSVRNLAEVDVLFADQLNAYDVLLSDDVVFTPAALDAFKTAKGAGTRAAAETEPGGTDALAASDARSTAGLEPDAAETDSTAPAAPVAEEPVAADALADAPSTEAIIEEASE